MRVGAEERDASPGVLAHPQAVGPQEAAPHERLAETLASALRRQIHLVRSLQAAARDVQAALMARDLGGLAAAAQEQLRLSRELAEAAGERQLPQPPAWASLAPEERAELEPLARELAASFAELQAQQQLNRRLLEDALAHTAFVLQALTGSGPDPGVYGPPGGKQGRTGSAPLGRRAVDRRA